MESHHLVKSPILLGARKRLRRYLSTDSRRGGGGCWKKKKLAQYVLQYCLFILVSYVFFFFLQKSSLASLCSILPFRKILYLYVFFICNLLFVFLLFVYLLSFFIYVLACNIYYLAQLVPIFLAHAGMAGPASPPSLLTPLPSS